MADTPDPGFIIPNLRFTGRFRILFWIFKHRNLYRSLPMLKRNTGMLVKANVKRSRAIIRNIVEGSRAFQSVADEVIINNLPQRFVNNYLILSS